MQEPNQITEIPITKDVSTLQTPIKEAIQSEATAAGLPTNPDLISPAFPVLHVDKVVLQKLITHFTSL